MIKVISFKICPFVQRVTAVLEAKKVSYEIDYIELNNKPQWFLDISPTGQVPVIITESGNALFESDAIIEYIDDLHGPLEEGLSPEEKALDRAWSYQASKHYLIQCSAMRSADRTTLSEREEQLAKSLARAENQLGSGCFFKGEQLSKVDIAWLPLLHRAAVIERKSCYDFLANFPKVKRWQKALLETGLAEKSVPEDFVERFAAFYLSEQTELGRRANCCTTDRNQDQDCSTESCC